MTRTRYDLRWSLISLPLVILAACNDPNARGKLRVAVSTVRPTTAASAAIGPFAATAPTVIAANDSTVIALSPDTIVLKSAQLVLGRIELKQVTATMCADEEDGDGAAGAPQQGAQVNDEDDDCEEVEAGPTLITLPLGNVKTETMVEVTVPAGQYNRVEFRIHKPGDGAGDAALLAAHPEFNSVSIRVTGTFSHAGAKTNFTFTSDLDASQEVVLDPPLTVAQGANGSVTLRIDVSGWFLGGAGGALIDPATANKGGANESVVKHNIERSIDAFRDDDHDGHDDDDAEDDHDGGHAG